MSEEFWAVNEHVIPASHLRGFKRGIRDDQTGRLRLAIKQYVPKQSPDHDAGSVTVIMAQAVGTSKESYEPFFDELLHCGLPIRAIWAMDAAHHGASYLLNENIIGDDPNWYDNSRDMMQMVNHFQELMPPPIIAVGLSWGSITVVGLSKMHPRLFTSIVLMEPPFALHLVIRAKDRVDRGFTRNHRAVAITKRRDIWPSRAAARERLRAGPHYGAFDPRVFERVMKYDLRPASRKQCDDVGSPDAVTLTTPKSMEAATAMRPDPPFDGYPEESDLKERPDDIDSTVVQGFYRGEIIQIYRELPYILPSTLVVWAGNSWANTSFAEESTDRIGTGYGGNGGIATGRVKRLDIPSIGHHLPLEQPGVVAKTISKWLQPEIARWNEEQAKQQPPFDVALHPEWIRRVAKL